jgi:hypothetical protein
VMGLIIGVLSFRQSQQLSDMKRAAKSKERPSQTGLS